MKIFQKNKQHKLLHNIFQKARLKLTLYYAAIMLLILLAFSSILIVIVESKIKENFNGKIIITPEKIDPIRDTSDAIEILIYSIDGVLLLIISLCSYFLAGRTLKPIKESMDAQNKFSADASHDLRTPIAIITTESQVLIQSETNDIHEWKKVVKSNLEEAQKMSLLVSDLLMIARGIDKGVVKENINFSDLVSAIVEKMSSQIFVKGIVLEKNIQKNIYLNVSKEEIERAIKNVLQNAINYTNTGVINIDLKSENKKVILKIIDSGVGMGTEDLPFVFDRFYKAEHSRNDHSGSGLGLPIAKDIVERNDGLISIKSVFGAGTTVCIEFSV